MNLETQLNKDSATEFQSGIDRLVEGIKKHYASWTTYEEGIERFNKGIDIKTGRKYTKVLQGSSVWGFIANSDGMLKGIPYFKGDVFKAAGWAAPAKHVRGSIFDTNQNWFHWTGPNYRV
ncbi:MAG: hypothetical protein CMB81_05805 [Flammeovirgaceae bacterium]|nr:hypothetical protein [Flammeovirgaceae bacterium]|tara:strand:+ start:708 stop:1067 length:360 start_codon:yes stop_codon:yes gene_type:complete